MLNRKELIKNSVVTLGVLGLANEVYAQGKNPTSESKHKYAKALLAANNCKLAAEICINHCMDELAKGNKMMANCLKTASETKAACESFVALASMESGFTKKMAALCIEICKSCEAECKKHISHSPICKDCMESCKACIKEMSAI